MWEVNACTVCFRSDVKLFKMESDSLGHEFLLVTGLEDVDRIGMPQYLCVECAAYVRKFKLFRDKCTRAHYILADILHRNKQIKKDDLEIYTNGLHGIQSTLSYLDMKNIYFEKVQSLWTNAQPHTSSYDVIPILQCNIPLQNNFDITDLNDGPPLTIAAEQSHIKTEQDDKTLDVEFEINFNKHEEPSSSLINIESTSLEAKLEDSNDMFKNDAFFNFDSDTGPEDLPVKEESKTDANIKDDDKWNLNEEYAKLVAISEREAKAVVEILKSHEPKKGNHQCTICGEAFKSEMQHDAHSHLHYRHISGNFYCCICHYYFKTDIFLKAHMLDKHMYKYVCKKCPEVNFDRESAKQHYLASHLTKAAKALRKARKAKTIIRRPRKVPDDFPSYTAISHEEQYQIIEDRKVTKNYLDAPFKCELCFKGYLETKTYNNHMKKHRPDISGTYQCDVCKIFFKTKRKIALHMNKAHLAKYTCQTCNYMCYSKDQARTHYGSHNNVIYKCPHCDREFKKASSRHSHIRLKHPSMYVCNICGHSYVSETGMYFHKKLRHTPEEIKLSESMVLNKKDPCYCPECDMQFFNDTAYRMHLGSSGKHATTNLAVNMTRASRAKKTSSDGKPRPRGRPRLDCGDIVTVDVSLASHCELCNEFLINDTRARMHYKQVHSGNKMPKRYMCDVCGHTTRLYSTLAVHKRMHTNDRPFDCPHCDRKFTVRNHRDRHLVVHTGERKFKCHLCERRFTQKNSVKLHIQTVHLKIPYAPWNKKNRNRNKELEGRS